ncbi:AraC family transcriptional regulator [Pararhizobium sp. DWP3-4]|uniref:AraC family transcriptional regulator n=1 Tax=Pararhizobium sp. DWP3-4 TaxID=2804565 RepID=UPI003CEBB0A2
MSDHSMESEADEPPQVPIDEPTLLERRRWPRDSDPSEKAGVPNGPALEPLYFSTHGLAPSQQFSAWRAHMAPLIEVGLPDDKSQEDGFSVDQIAWNMGNLLIVQQRAPAHSYTRSLSMLRRSPFDHWCVELPRAGRSWTEVDRRVAESGPDLLAFRSLGYPYRGRTTNSDSILLFMPYEQLAGHAGLMEAANNSIFSGNLAKLLLHYVTGVESNLNTLTAEELPRLVHTISDLIVACASLSVATVAPSKLPNMGMMERAHRYIHGNLRSDELTLEKICRSLGISRTRLYQLFSASGGVLNYIRKQRLLAAYADLSDATNTRPISEIAEAAGFDLAANFSRAFSHEFGVNPRDIRKAATLQPSRSPIPPGGRYGGSFGDWLSVLGK